MSYVSDHFEMLSGIIKCIAKEFGVNCEVVLHDLTLPYDRTIVAIENGFVTGRKVGDSGTNIGLEILRGTVEGSDRYNYVNHTKNGHILRSSSHYIKNAAGKVVGSVCINFDITDLVMAQKSLQYLASMDALDSEGPREVFTGNVDELMDILMQETVTRAGKPVSSMSKEDKVEAVRYLDSRGVFLIKKSVDRVSEFYGVSKFTLYNYLDEGRGGDDAKEDKPAPGVS